ncbi:MAG: ATP-grasp domain-containing protein [Deltaproteobacteria bacterium]|nr:ATP-grasp domain-containing protein [Deltaproteobacteria bacterium]
MPLDINPCDLPVLLLYNVEPAWTSREKAEVISLTSQLGEAMSAVSHPVTPVPLANPDISSVLKSYSPQSNIVLNWCESVPGIPHSEPLVARSLESLGFTFTGASSAALALSQDKRRVKEILEQSTIPTPQWRVFDRPAADGWNQFPAIVKAVYEHCSEGITCDSVVMTEAELVKRIAFILEVYRQPALVEEFIDGREFHVSFWGNGHVTMLPPAEMDFSRFSDVHDRLCTYESKCVPGSLHYEGIQTLLPAPLEKDELRALEQVCKAAYVMMGCRDYGRIDVRVRDGIHYVLDVNPNADISADASLACAAELAGFPYGEMGSRIVRLAARRHQVWSNASSNEQS